EVVPDIIRDACPGLPDTQVGQAAEYASGFPQIAVLLGRSWQRDPDSGGALGDRPMTLRLLFGRAAPDEDALRIARACALFSFVGVTGDVQGQVEYVASELCGTTVRRVFE